MKIEYKFIDEIVTIDIEDCWGEIILDLDRLEYNVNHKETSRHTSLYSYLYEGKDFACEDEELSKLFEEDQEKKLHLAI